MSEKSEFTLPAVARTTLGLRDALFDEINGLRSMTTSVQRARVVAQLAHRIVEATRLEFQYFKELTKGGKAREAVQLGTPVEPAS